MNACTPARLYAVGGKVLSYNVDEGRPLNFAVSGAEDCSSPSASMLKTYIVEDSPVIRENLIATLEELVPLKVIGWAEGARGALDWLQAIGNDCDLIIVDLFLRQGSGMQVLQQLAQDAHPADRVVLTNYATADVRRQCLSLGASHVFDKSGEIDALIEHCLRLAQRHPLPPAAPGSSGVSAG